MPVMAEREPMRKKTVGLVIVALAVAAIVGLLVWDLTRVDEEERKHLKFLEDINKAQKESKKSYDEYRKEIESEMKYEKKTEAFLKKLESEAAKRRTEAFLKKLESEAGR